MHAPAPAERLPSDVLAYLLAYIPFVPRLRALSVLSKRWRTAFIKSVTDDRALANASQYELALSLFPNIPQHFVAPGPSAACSSGDTRRIHVERGLCRYRSTRTVVSVSTNLPPPTCDNFAPFVALHASTLRSLTLTVVPPSMMMELLSFRFPVLHTLHLPHLAPRCELSFASFLTAHRHQLEEATLPTDVLVDEPLAAVLCAPFPRLRSVALTVTARCPHASHVLSTLKQPTELSLTLWGAESLVPLLSAAHSVLTALRAPLPYSQPGILVALEQCRLLTKLAQLDHEVLPPYSAVASRLRETTLPLAHLAAYPRMRTCVLTVASGDDNLTLPSTGLETVSIQLRTMHAASELCRRLVCCSPRLRLLRLHLPDLDEARDESVLLRLQDDIYALGQLDRLELHVTADEARSYAQDTRRYPWMACKVHVIRF